MCPEFFKIRSQRFFNLALVFGLSISLCACPAHRKPIPPGIVPAQGNLQSVDEQYGHEVLSGLTEQFPLSKDDQKINRVRNIVDRLTSAAHADHNPWHVYVLESRDFKNAAATRGNYVFIWTPMLNSFPEDGELATVIAHEIGHVLAGHTDPDPAEEVNSILAGTAGKVASEVLARTGGSWGLAAGLAGSIVEEGLKALIVNPESQNKELEADHIGLFLMADAGYDPRLALRFWERASHDPALSGMSVSFLSSHPSSSNRLAKLEQYIDQATERYQSGAAKSKMHPRSSKKAPLNAAAKQEAGIWVVKEDWVSVYHAPNRNSSIRIDLPRNAEVRGTRYSRSWIELKAPVSGFVASSALAPM